MVVKYNTKAHNGVLLFNLFDFVDDARFLPYIPLHFLGVIHICAHQGASAQKCLLSYISSDELCSRRYIKPIMSTLRDSPASLPNFSISLMASKNSGSKVTRPNEEQQSASGLDSQQGHTGQSPSSEFRQYLPGGETYQRLLGEISSGNPRTEPVPQWLDGWQQGYDRLKGDQKTDTFRK